MEKRLTLNAERLTLKDFTTKSTKGTKEREERSTLKCVPLRPVVV
jgi:hypothetical protein